VSTGVGVPVPTGRLQILAATRPRNEASCWTTTATKTNVDSCYDPSESMAAIATRW